MNFESKIAEFWDYKRVLSQEEIVKMIGEEKLTEANKPKKHNCK